MGKQTINDFSAQWSRHTLSEGYDAYDASTEQLADICGPLLDLADIAGKKVAEIGSGPGRIINMLMELGAAHAIALEPAPGAMASCKANTTKYADRITYIEAVGEDLPPRGDRDYVFSIGVLHHIEDPRPAVRAAYHALKPGGKLVIWLYGREGNGLYLAFALPLRAVTTRLPDAWLDRIAAVLDRILDPYIWLARRCRFLPMSAYLTNIYARLSRAQRRVNIFDQLNPAYAKYYRRQEAYDLVASAGFEATEVVQRFGYSWAVKGVRPEN